MNRLSKHELRALYIVNRFGYPKTVDYTIRRKLVDEGYLERIVQPIMYKYSLTSKGQRALKQGMAKCPPKLDLWDHLKGSNDF